MVPLMHRIQEECTINSKTKVQARCNYRNMIQINLNPAPQRLQRIRTVTYNLPIKITSRRSRRRRFGRGGPKAHVYHFLVLVMNRDTFDLPEAGFFVDDFTVRR